MMNFKKTWKNNSIQFPRLLAEIRAVGLTPEQIQDLMSSMDLTKNQLAELFDRAEEEFEQLKNNRLPSRKKNSFKEDESFSSYRILKKVVVNMLWNGEGKSGDYNRDDPTDYPRLRFDAIDLTGKERDSQDNSFCTEMTTSLTAQVRESVCRHIAHVIVNEPRWKRRLEELSWLDDAQARNIHLAYIKKGTT